MISDATKEGDLAHAGQIEWVIEPHSAKATARFRECWQYRKLFGYFAGRTLKRVYARTVLGWSWLILRPVVPIVLASWVFGNLLAVPTGGVPYFLFYLVGITCWHMFDHSWMWTTRSIEMNRRIIQKIYVPRLILPVSSVAPVALEVLVYLILLSAAMVYFFVADGKLYVDASSRLWVAPLMLLLAVGFAISLGLWTSVWGATVRDIRFTLRYVLQIWFYITPVVYPLSIIPENWRWLVAVNPMAPVVETFKWSLLGIGEPQWSGLLYTLSATAIIGGAGLWYFTKAEAAALD